MGGLCYLANTICTCTHLGVGQLGVDVRVLVIDDNKNILFWTSECLRAAGHDVITADNAMTGLPHIAAGGIDVLLTEIVMPDMDGIAIIKQLRRGHPNLWIVAMSGGESHLPADAALTMSQAFGADKILYKPFMRRELLAAIRKP